ncbi:hypothetical protein XI09_00205 [Bradyrhizobium sp. CCBAU 11386]|nr:hypothetical protein [Bradyrhizobium sp. CCBAU 11386]
MRLAFRRQAHAAGTLFMRALLPCLHIHPLAKKVRKSRTKARFVAAIGGLGDTFDDVDRARNGVPVKRGCATRRIGDLDDHEFLVIARQWKTFENLARDTGKPGLLSACPTVGTFTHWAPVSSRVAS